MKKASKEQEIAPPMPHSENAERSVLGAILLDERAFDDVSRLKPGDFWTQRHLVIFEAMTAMREADEPIDLPTLTEKLHAQKKLELAGGPGYLAQLFDGMPRITNVAHYASIVKQKSVLRRLIHLAESFQQKAFENSQEVPELLESCSQEVQELALQCVTPKLMGKTSQEARFALLQGFEKKEALLRINTGLAELDKVTGGFRPRELVTITASVTGSGKTLFAQQIKCNSCKEGHHGLYFSGEMSAEQLAAREIATESGVPHWKMRRPEQLTPEEYKALFDNAMACLTPR